MDGSGVAGVGFVVAGGDGPELLQLGEGVLDQVAPAVHVAVEADDGLAVGLGRDHRGGTTLVKLRPEPVGVEGLVAEQGAAGAALEPRPPAEAGVGRGGPPALAPRSSSSALSQSVSKALPPSRAPKATPSISGCTPTLSWRWPGSRRKRTRLPRAPTRAPSLVGRPRGGR